MGSSLRYDSMIEGLSTEKAEVVSIVSGLFSTWENVARWLLFARDLFEIGMRMLQYLGTRAAAV